MAGQALWKSTSVQRSQLLDASPLDSSRGRLEPYQAVVPPGFLRRGPLLVMDAHA
jgi:hypothetical protein